MRALLLPWILSPPSSTAWCEPSERQAVIGEKPLRNAATATGDAGSWTTGSRVQVGRPIGCCTAWVRVKVTAGVIISWRPSSTWRVRSARWLVMPTTSMPPSTCCMASDSKASNQARIQFQTPIRSRSAGARVQLTGIWTTSALARSTVRARWAAFQFGAAAPSASTMRKGSRSGQACPNPIRVTDPGLGSTSGRTV